MSRKAYIIALSFAGAAASAGFLMMPPRGEPATAPAADARARAARSSWPQTAPPNLKSGPAAAEEAALSGTNSAHFAVADSAPLSRAAKPPLPLEERAAKVEQEANRELNRLVTLLNLSDEQQDRVFQTLAKHSRHWSPEMQFGDTGAAAAGKRSPLTPALTLPGGDGPAKTAPVETTPVKDTAPATDPLEEIMSILDPEQQTALLKDEMDRAAWWAEILPQLLPPDEIPGLDGNPPSPGAGEVREYEGSDVLE